MPPRHTPATSPYAELAFSGYAADIIFAISPLRHAIIAIEADDTLFSLRLFAELIFIDSPLR
jgi:hypothetical protein